MTREEEEAILSAAIETWGAQAQTLMVMEEMSELQKELCKRERGRDNLANIAEEIADVEIMLDQMKLLHGCAGMVAEYRMAKIERLRERLEKERRSRDG